jgi:hypothetical protein
VREKYILVHYEKGKNIFFIMGGYMVFGPIYRPLYLENQIKSIVESRPNCSDAFINILKYTIPISLIIITPFYTKNVLLMEWQLS